MSLAIQLRAETRLHHERLHGCLDYLLRQDLTRARYARYLSRMAVWLAPTELAVRRRLASSRFALPLRDRMPALARDLAILGLTPETGDPPDVPSLDCEAHAVGCVYVLEGSALGGQVIVRHLRSVLGVTAEDGATYLAGDAEQTGPRWKRVCEAIEGFGTEEADSVVEGANRTFESLGRWFA